MPRAFFCLCLLFAASPSYAQSLFINEFMARNMTAVTDAFGEHDDWVEIYNAGPDSVDLAGYYLTDNLNNPTQARLSDTDSSSTTIPPDGYLVIWLDDQPHQGLLHLPFKLNGSGEQLGLFSPDGETPIDTLTYNQQALDLSYGRIPDAAQTLSFLSDPTPGSSNSDASIVEIAETPVFSLANGSYTGSQTVSLSTPNGSEIHYTLDGSDPEDDSARYTVPLTLDQTTVVRARGFESGKLPSPIQTHTYLIDIPYTLPVVSLVSDPANLFDDETGIYAEGNPDPDDPLGANYWQDWERPAHVEYFDENHEPGFGQDLGVRIYGGGSRVLPKKSFTIRARGIYGPGSIDYPMFEDKPDLDRFDGLVLRANGQSWFRWRNDFIYEFNRRSGKHLDMQAYKPAVLLINGAYWGVYNITERKDKDFVQNNHNISDEVDLLHGFFSTVDVVEGSRQAYRDLHDFLASDAVPAPDGFEQMEARMDLISFIDFWIYQIYSDRTDVENNVRFWRPRTPEGRWRWITFDFENSLYGCRADRTPVADAARITPHLNVFLLGFALRNPAFRDLFLNRFMDVLNTTLLPDRVYQINLDMATHLRPEMGRDAERWPYFGIQSSEWESEWDRVTRIMESSSQELLVCIRDELRTFFGLSGEASVSVGATPGGQVELNTLMLDEYPWSGLYFRDVPITLTAKPEHGYAFTGWTGSITSDDATITITPTGDLTLTAVFTELPPPPDIIISEINYHSSPDFDPEDWVELYNPNPEPIDLSGWIFRDGNIANTFVLPDSTFILPDRELVLCRDVDRFRTTYGTDCIGNFDFGLSNAGDLIRLFDPNLLLADSLRYDDEGEWPIEPDGSGATLELLHPTLDNSLPQNWAASLLVGGTPGQPNTVWRDSLEQPPDIIISEINYHSSPDFDPGDWVEFYNPNPDTIDLSGWIFRDGNIANTFVLPDSTFILPGLERVLCHDADRFHAAYGTDCIGNFDFGLSNAGDLIRLFDRNLLLVDSLRYDDEGAWPVEADGSGPTLELLHPTLDNSLPQNWTVSQTIGGTPGLSNSVWVSTSESSLPITTHTLMPNYPNPFRNSTRIGYALPEGGMVMIRVYNNVGQTVQVLSSGLHTPGRYEVEWAPQNLSAGLYFYQLTVDGSVKATRSALLLR